jgi:hypothetical protein
MSSPTQNATQSVILEYTSRKTGERITEGTPFPGEEEALFRSIWLVVNGIAVAGSCTTKPADQEV